MKNYNFKIIFLFFALLFFEITTFAENTLSGSIGNELPISFAKTNIILNNEQTEIFIRYATKIRGVDGFDGSASYSYPNIFSMRVEKIKIEENSTYEITIENTKINRYNYQYVNDKIVPENKNYPGIKNGKLNILKFNKEIIELSFNLNFENGRDLIGSYTGEYSYGGKGVRSDINDATVSVDANNVSDENKLNDKSKNNHEINTPQASSGCGLIRNDNK